MSRDVCSLLLVLCVLVFVCDGFDKEKLYGYGEGTKGGSGGKTVTATTLSQLESYCGQNDKLIIKVSGTFRANKQISVKSYKSIIGVGSAVFEGVSFRMKKVEHVIIRNLVMARAKAPLDLIQMQFSKYIWIDHNDFSSDTSHGKSYYDGMVDATHACDFITISWNKMSNHYKNSLVGHSDNNKDEDTGHLRLTYHHNWFYNTNSRNPSVRFGKVHVVNNFYEKNNAYGIASRMGACVKVERNYFDSVKKPIKCDTSLSKTAGGCDAVSTNKFTGTYSNSIKKTCSLSLPYSFPAESADAAKENVKSGCGAGKINGDNSNSNNNNDNNNDNNNSNNDDNNDNNNSNNKYTTKESQEAALKQAKDTKKKCKKQCKETYNEQKEQTTSSSQRKEIKKVYKSCKDTCKEAYNSAKAMIAGGGMIGLSALLGLGGVGLRRRSSLSGGKKQPQRRSVIEMKQQRLENVHTDTSGDYSFSRKVPPSPSRIVHSPRAQHSAEHGPNRFASPKSGTCA